MIISHLSFGNAITFKYFHKVWTSTLWVKYIFTHWYIIFPCSIPWFGVESWPLIQKIFGCLVVEVYELEACHIDSSMSVVIDVQFTYTLCQQEKKKKCILLKSGSLAFILKMRLIYTNKYRQPMLYCMGSDQYLYFVIIFQMYSLTSIFFSWHFQSNMNAEWLYDGGRSNFL